MYDLESTFGISSPDLAAEYHADPQTPAAPAIATTEATSGPPGSAFRALTDPQGSAIFWVAIAAILGLAMVSGQLKVSAALAARGGKK